MTLPQWRRSLVAVILIGIGMGGFVDGILFHQILQLHNMLSNVVLRNTLENEQINMFWDGLFHAFTWTMTAAGIVLFWNTARGAKAVPGPAAFWGSVLLGWGLFNLVEGLIDHQILQVHHVYQNGNHFLWDMVFLLAGAVFCVTGGTLVRSETMKRQP